MVEFKLEGDGGGGNYITYVKTQQTYKPASGDSVNIYLWLTFINTIRGKHHVNTDKRKMNELQHHQKESRKLDSSYAFPECILMNMKMAGFLCDIFQHTQVMS